MSSNTIAIPAARSSSTAYDQSPKAGGSSSSSSYSSSPQTPSSSVASPDRSARKLGSGHQRRQSLLSSAFCKDECTVINIGDPDGAPRLISYLASSQGFAWNPELFVPSYVDCDYVPLENRREPVHEIRLSDEEIKAMLP
ncbi:uncharacterized protein F4807DRAFT_462505 [Annulohypoxylon truncatum]|uniref:uncharacterized protein n=1 Tax=Annulohypoxylon truncatum TaxID=327061 RepID=UPI00200796D1|nr:uncharacterized protein F4807DRAFT_462505 [Annulohypoxylon truncatum]KAI1207702.1 hypothetical protein F4807DRAFT_462505 [Annulohypoxylon truncatum]